MTSFNTEITNMPLTAEEQPDNEAKRRRTDAALSIFSAELIDPTTLTDEERGQLEKAGYPNYGAYLKDLPGYVDMKEPEYISWTSSSFKKNVVDYILQKRVDQPDGLVVHISDVVEKYDGENREKRIFHRALRMALSAIGESGYTGTTHVIFYSDDKAKCPNPNLFDKLKKGKMKLKGKLAKPGGKRPFSTVTIDASGKKTMRVNGGRFGNMQNLPKPTTEEQERILAFIKSILKGFWWTKEAYIHLLKLLAAAQFDYLRKEGVSKEECMDQFEKFCNPELTCKEQKSLGQKAQLSPVYFELTPDLSVMIKAFIDMLQAFLDPEFWHFLKECRDMDIEVWEAAIQGGFGRFSGFFHDTVWGSGGSAQLCIPAQALQEVSDKPPRGIFGQGVKMLMDAMRGEERALQFLGLDAEVTQANLGMSCLQLATKIWQCLEKANDVAKAQKEAKEKAQQEAEAKALDVPMKDA